MPTPQWLQHPVTVFALPLVVLLCAPHIYKLLPAGTNPSYDEVKLQRIADLMTDIYGTLSNSTFIPFNAVQQGPHHINTTALPCKPSAPVLRLMELLPYVDSSLVHEPDWIYGGHFMDYRNSDHVAELCDPLRGQSIGWTDYMAPSDIALTNWGTGGWNNDRSWIMIYNTERDSIRIFDAEEWVHRSQAQLEFGEEMSAWWFEDSGEWIWDRPDGATHVLRAIANNYRKLKWTPWETSNREPAFGLGVNKLDAFDLEDDFVRDYMKHNHWPNKFHPVKFRAAVIRAKHTPHGQTFMESFEARISSRTETQAYIKERLTHHRAALSNASNDDERWLHHWRIQKREWDLEDNLAELSLLKDEKEELCPAEICRPDPPVLWQHWALARSFEAAQYNNKTEKCGSKLGQLDAQRQWIYGDPRGLPIEHPSVSRYRACVANDFDENQSIRMALEASRVDAVEYCKEPDCKLLPSEDAWKRAELTIDVYKRDIAAAEARKAKAIAFRSQIPSNIETKLSEMHESIILLDRDIQSLAQTLEHLEIMIQQPRYSGNELHRVLENMYEVHGMTDYGIGPVAKEAFREYQKWLWLKQIQRQIKTSGGWWAEEEA